MVDLRHLVILAVTVSSCETTGKIHSTQNLKLSDVEGSVLTCNVRGYPKRHDWSKAYPRPKLGDSVKLKSFDIVLDSDGDTPIVFPEQRTPRIGSYQSDSLDLGELSFSYQFEYGKKKTGIFIAKLREKSGLILTHTSLVSFVPPLSEDGPMEPNLLDGTGVYFSEPRRIAGQEFFGLAFGCYNKSLLITKKQK